MEPVAEHRTGDMSKSDVLRGIITEKLSTAAREILAAVERTVSGYEEEAAGFRLQVERQRRQLEALLQPRVKLERRDAQQLFPISEPPPEEELSGSGEPVQEKEQQHKYELSAEADGGMSLPCFTGEYTEEEESPERASSTPTKDEEPITEFSEAQNHVDLRIRILGDSGINVLSRKVYRKYPLRQLQCPRGLQETDFLQLLRSTFPQLVADFDFFTTDRSRKLLPLKVQTLTPEEIDRSIKSNGNSALYIRIKNQEFRPSQREDAAADSPSCHSGVPSDSSMPQIKETLNPINLKLRILEDPETMKLSNEVFQTSPLQLQCPHGLQETDFLQLLRSTFPQLAGDRPFDIFTSSIKKKLHPLIVETLTPEEILRSSRSCGRSSLYIRLKAPEEAQSSKEMICRLQGGVDAADETRLGEDIRSSSSTSQGQEDEDIRTSESDNEPLGHWSLLVSESEREEDETIEKRDRSEKSLRNKELRETLKRRAKRSDAKTKRSLPSPPASFPWALTSDGKVLPSCKVCGAVHRSVRFVIKHAWSHVDNPAQLCGVCGERSESAEELRQHLESHQKTHDCHICGKLFLSTNGLKGHIARHNGEKSYKCKICHKLFIEFSMLNAHMMIHAVKTSHVCDVCQKSFSSKCQLKLHRLTHSDKKPYSCNVCAKSYRCFATLSQHMCTHSSSLAARAQSHVCEICSKKFHTSWKLRAHVKNHSTGGKRSREFSSKSKLMTSIKIRTL
ncbi:uncharacterized protein [Paralichthys olivaceus]|uniref:uncharacterized protein isoform X2 n=1 Tax=Paralichthys olivaceus TaxID=8255 RepID=UPI003750C575